MTYDYVLFTIYIVYYDVIYVRIIPLIVSSSLEYFFKINNS